MSPTSPQPCRSPYRLWLNGVPHHVCKCGHYGQPDVTLLPRPAVAS